MTDPRASLLFVQGEGKKKKGGTSTGKLCSQVQTYHGIVHARMFSPIAPIQLKTYYYGR